MRINKFLAVVLMVFSVVFLPFESALAEVTTTKGGELPLTGDMVKITYIVPGQAPSTTTISAADLLNAFGNAFAEIKDAVRAVQAAIAAAEKGAVTTASTDVWISAKVKVNIMSTGIGGGSGGGGGCANGVASCN
ncbi:MAG TPA: hypothetical protein DF427_04545 [Moraxellaceae bacterium]|nr:hypothetical protein [Moraxellaceae bacterium]